jgi:hypothetical protein
VDIQIINRQYVDMLIINRQYVHIQMDYALTRLNLYISVHQRSLPLIPICWGEKKKGVFALAQKPSPKNY